MPVLLKEQKPPKRQGPPKCQIFTVIFLILAAFSIGAYFLYTKYIKKEICYTEECFKGSLSVLSSIDNSVNPCVDFYLYTCGNYSKRDLELGTESQHSYPKFILENQINSLITETDSESEWHLLETQRQFYQLCRDTSIIDDDKNDNLLGLLNETVGWPMLQGPWDSTSFDLTNFLLSCYELGIPFERFFRISFNTDLSLLQLAPPLDLEQFDDDVRTLIYHKLIVDTVTSLGGLEYTAEIEAEKMIEFEKSLKKVWDSYDAGKEVPFSLADIRRQFPKIDVILLLNRTVGEYNEHEDNVTAANSDVLLSLNLLLSGTPPRTLVNFVIWKFVVDQGLLVASPLRERFEVYYKMYSKISNKITRRDICLGEAKRRFPRVGEIAWMKTILDKDKSKLSSLIKNVQEALISRIESVDYITKTMKKQAIDQIKNKKHIFFPLYDDAFPGILDSIQLFNVTQNVFTMALELNTYNYQLRMKLIHEVQQLVEEYLDDSLVYEISFTDEAIVLPPVYLQEYYFSSTRPNYLNYATLGMEISKKLIKDVIEHIDETKDISDGILANSITWANQDLLDLFLRSRCAAENYLAENDGELTAQIFLENCQDLISIDIVYEAFIHFLKKHPDPNLPLITHNTYQIFWIYFGKQYCSEDGEEYNGLPLRYRLENAIKNSRYFGRDFNCAVGTEMNPEKKCIII